MLDVGHNTDPARQSRLLRMVEGQGSEFVPDVGHVLPGVVLLADGSLLAMVSFPGYPFELESMNARNIRRRQINDLMRGMADSNVTFAVHLTRTGPLPVFDPGTFRSRFARDLFAKRARQTQADLVECWWWLTVVVEPRLVGQGLFNRLFRRSQSTVSASQGLLRQLSAIMTSVESYFGPDDGVRLGLRERDGWPFSQIGEARKLFITGRYSEVPLTTGLLGSAIYTERVVAGTRMLKIGERGYAKTICLRDYPGDDDKEDVPEAQKKGGTKTGQLSHLVGMLDAEGRPFPFVLAQSFRFQSREESNERLRQRTVRMENTKDVQKRGIEKMGAVREEVVGGQTVRGHHSFALTVFAPDMDQLHAARSAAESAIIAGAMVPIAEDGGSFAAFWQTLPGNPEWLEGRSASISSRNFTALASLEAYPRGQSSGHWGPASVRFPTLGKTAYDFVPHVGDVGHALFLGFTGSGKTLHMNLLELGLEPYKRGDGRVFIFDKDRGSQGAVLASGGVYLPFRSGEPSGAAPLRGTATTPEGAAFLGMFIATLMESDGRGPISPKTHEGIRRGVASSFRLPPHQRGMGGVRAFLGYGEGSDGPRLDRWCEGGADGWLFDGPTDDIMLDAPTVGFDLTALLEHRAAPHVGVYLISRINALIDGRPITVICDEVRFYLLSPVFAEMIKDFALTLRKKNGQLWIAAQEPGHILNSAVGSDLANQAQTMWVFGARDANPEQYQRLGFTGPMYRAITETMPALPYRTVLLKRDRQSAILRLDLPGMADEIAALSGRLTRKSGGQSA